MNEATHRVFVTTIRRIIANTVKWKLLAVPFQLSNREIFRAKHVSRITENVLRILYSANAGVMGFAAVRARQTQRAADILTELIEELEEARIDVLRGFLSAIAVALASAVAHEFSVRKML